MTLFMSMEMIFQTGQGIMVIFVKIMSTRFSYIAPVDSVPGIGEDHLQHHHRISHNHLVLV